jgi:hypothetical protein
MNASASHAQSQQPEDRGADTVLLADATWMGRADLRPSVVGLPSRAKNARRAAAAAARDERPRRFRAMTEPTCTPLRTLGPIADREQRPDRLAELLDCMAELMVETAKVSANLEQHRDSEDPRVCEAIAGLAELQGSLRAVGLKAASVHQQLQHVHLI